MSPHNPVVAALDAVELGQPRTYRNVTVMPLLVREPQDPEYVTLDEALAAGWVAITEVGDSGTVPELSLVNHGPRPVLLLDGEELVGAKQNRVLNLTVLVAAASKVVIPVSCVEAGRWRRVSHRFTAAPRAQFAEGRAARMRHVTESMRTSGSRRSQQGEVWRAIEEKAARLGTQSDTGAMSAMFEHLETVVDGFVGAFEPSARQAGAVFAINGRVVGLELFDAPATWRKLSPKVIRSYAMDAIDRRDGTSAPLTAEAVNQLFGTLRSSEASEFPAVALGSDVRLAGPELIAAALVNEGRCVHISAFDAINAGAPAAFE